MHLTEELKCYRISNRRQLYWRHVLRPAMHRNVIMKTTCLIRMDFVHVNAEKRTQKWPQFLLKLWCMQNAPDLNPPHECMQFIPFPANHKLVSKHGKTGAQRSRVYSNQIGKCFGRPETANIIFKKQKLISSGFSIFLRKCCKHEKKLQFWIWHR